MGVRSGERAGYSMAPLRPIHVSGKAASRCRRFMMRWTLSFEMFVSRAVSRSDFYGDCESVSCICSFFPGLVDVRGRPERFLLTFWTVPSASNFSLMRAMVRRVGGLANSLLNRLCTSMAFSVFQ